MTATLSTKTYTAEEYLALEVESDIRHEFRNGEIVAIAGGTPEHNQISGALYALIWFELRKKAFTIFMTDQRLWIPAVNIHTYPDVMIVKDPVQLQPGRKDTVTNPLLIAETLSESTEAYDRNKKFEHYRSIETFQEYVLIDQCRPYVEHYKKQAANQWLFTEYSDLQRRFQLSSVDVEIALADLYEAVKFEPMP